MNIFAFYVFYGAARDVVNTRVFECKIGLEWF